MSEALVSQRSVAEIIGRSRLQRLRAAGWLEPVKNDARSVLFNLRDVHLALSRAERQRCPVNQVEVMRVRLSEKLHNRAYVKKGRPQRPDPGDIPELDWSAYKADEKSSFA
jgi:hypothetical protein